VSSKCEFRILSPIMIFRLLRLCSLVYVTKPFVATVDMLFTCVNDNVGNGLDKELIKNCPVSTTVLGMGLIKNCTIELDCVNDSVGNGLDKELYNSTFTCKSTQY
jgi:hypothetical protein